MKLPFTPDLTSSHPAGSSEWWVEKWTKLEAVAVSNRRLSMFTLLAVGLAVLGDVGGAREVLRELVAGG